MCVSLAPVISSHAPRPTAGTTQWMDERSTESGIKELGSFVTGVERDYDAVRVGLTFHWSQGPIEGTVNKMKTHKRLMYRRASFTLLRQKLLHLI